MYRVRLATAHLIEALDSLVAYTQESTDMSKTRSHLALQATINRRDYGITWDAPLPNGGSVLPTRSQSLPSSRWPRRSSGDENPRHIDHA